MKATWSRLLWATEDRSGFKQTVSEHKPEEVRREGRILDQQFGERPEGGGGGLAPGQKPEAKPGEQEPEGEETRRS